MPYLRDEIKTALQDFNSKPLRKSALNLLDIRGYRSDRTLVLEPIMAWHEQGNGIRPR